MSDPALAQRLRDYIRTRRGELEQPILNDTLEDWTTYKAAVARLNELGGFEEAIAEIIKDINSDNRA